MIFLLAQRAYESDVTCIISVKRNKSSDERVRIRIPLVHAAVMSAVLWLEIDVKLTSGEPASSRGVLDVSGICSMICKELTWVDMS